MVEMYSKSRKCLGTEMYSHMKISVSPRFCWLKITWYNQFIILCLFIFGWLIIMFNIFINMNLTDLFLFISSGWEIYQETNSVASWRSKIKVFYWHLTRPRDAWHIKDSTSIAFSWMKTVLILKELLCILNRMISRLTKQTWLRWFDT